MRLPVPAFLPSARAEEKPDAPDADAFERGLKRLHSLLDRKQHEKGLRALEKLLRTHERRPWALGHRAELADVAERLAFGAAFPAPEPKDVVTGTIEKWKPRDGYLRVRYERETAADLERDKRGYVYFPVRARGSYLIEIYGASYPFSFDDAPVLEVAGGAHPQTGRQQNWVIQFGSPMREVGDEQTWLPGRIFHLDGTSNKKVSEVATCPAQLGQRYLLQVKVNDTRIHAAVNRKPVGTARKAKGLYGEFRFHAPGWETLIFSGTVEPSWIQSRLDERIEQQRATFHRTYERTDHLPAWLFEEPDAKVLAAKRRTLPGSLAASQEPAARSVREALARGEAQEARAALSLLASAGAPRPVVDFFEARIHIQEGHADKGLEAIERVLSKEEAFLPGQVLRGRLLGRLGRTEESLTAFQEALLSHPEDPLPYGAAIRSMMLAGRMDAAAAIVSQAARTGVRSEELDGLARAVSKAIHGPTWNRVFEYKSRNYHVFSNTDKQTCVEASKLLEQALTAYKVNFHWVGRDSERQYRVYLFGGKAGFLRYWQDLEAFVGHAPENVAGVYIPYVQQLLIWSLGDKDAMLETIRHEGFHQYLDRLLDDVPVWLNEGLAVYHENGVFERGRLRFGAVQEQRLELLRKTGLRPLSELLWLDAQGFYFGKDAFRNYAQAWAFIHLLKEGPAQERALLKRVVKDLQTGAIPPPKKKKK